MGACATMWVLFAVIAVVGSLYLRIDPIIERWAIKYLFGGWLVDLITYNQTLIRYGSDVLLAVWIVIVVTFCFWVGLIQDNYEAVLRKGD